MAARPASHHRHGGMDPDLGAANLNTTAALAAAAAAAAAAATTTTTTFPTTATLPPRSQRGGGGGGATALLLLRRACRSRRAQLAAALLATVFLALLQIRVALVDFSRGSRGRGHDLWTAPLATDMFGRRPGSATPRPCSPVALRTFDASGPFRGRGVLRRTCRYATAEDDVLVGVWHARRTEPRLRWILDSWGFGRRNVVFLGQADDSSACLPVLGTGAPKDDFQSTLHKGLMGLARMYDEHPEKKWYVVVGDDTYVNLRNLARVFSAFDAARPWCISEVTNISKYWYKGLRMNGGAGVATSRAFVAKLRPLLPRLVETLAAEAAAGRKRLLNMHDLVFGNLTWSLGLNVTHADGLYSQSPIYYQSIDGPGQMVHRRSHLSSGLVSRPGVLHYVTGPFMPWVHYILNAAQEPCAFQSAVRSHASEELAASMMTVADDVVVAVFRTVGHGHQWRGKLKGGVRDTFGMFFRTVFFKPSVACPRSVLERLLRMTTTTTTTTTTRDEEEERGGGRGRGRATPDPPFLSSSSSTPSAPPPPPQWFLLVTDAVYVAPQNLRALLDELNGRLERDREEEGGEQGAGGLGGRARVDVAARMEHGKLGGRSALSADSGLLVHRSVLETLLRRERALPCVPHAWHAVGGAAAFLFRGRHPRTHRMLDVLARKVERALHVHRFMHYGGLLPPFHAAKGAAGGGGGGGGGDDDEQGRGQCAVTFPLLAPDTAGSALYSRKLRHMCGSHKERRSLAVGWADVPLCRAALAFNAEADAEEAAADAEEKAARFRACMRRRARQGKRPRPGAQQCGRLEGHLNRWEQKEERLGQRSPCGSDVQLRVAHVLTWKQLRPADARSPLVALAADGPGI